MQGETALSILYRCLGGIAGSMRRVLTLPPDADDFPLRPRLIKLLFANGGLPRTERLSATRRKRTERGLWQRRFWEHPIRDERNYAKHIEYCHWNPMKHGYVQQMKDWPYSTFHRYVAAGLLPADWCCDLDGLETVPD